MSRLPGIPKKYQAQVLRILHTLEVKYARDSLQIYTDEQLLVELERRVGAKALQNHLEKVHAMNGLAQREAVLEGMNRLN